MLTRKTTFFFNNDQAVSINGCILHVHAVRMNVISIVSIVQETHKL